MEVRSFGSGLFGYDWKSGFVSPFQTCPKETIEHIAENQQFACSENMVICDLGSGDGALLRGLREFHPQHVYFGVELDPELAQKSIQADRHIEVLVGDLLDSMILNILVLEKADVIITFLLPSALKKLSSKFRYFLIRKPERKVITLGWPIPYMDEKNLKIVEHSRMKVGYYVYQYEPRIHC